MIALGDPVLGEDEKRALCSVIDSNWITMGDRVAAFEQAFAELHEAEAAVAVSSCTAGLHLSLKALGLGPGDEVLVPSLTFVATVNAILYVGATPVFVDIENVDLPHMSLADATTMCTPKTKAVLVMHYGGYIVDLPKWRSFADERQLLLIEDAAHAPGLDGVGKWSDAAVFSFFANKNMTTAEGGMVLARDSSVRDHVRHMRAHGMTTGTLDRHRGHAYTYDVTMLGYNYRMDELRAALGLVQLSQLTKWNSRRRELKDYYRRSLAKLAPEIAIPFTQQHKTAAHLMPILLGKDVDRGTFMQRLRNAGIQCSIHYPPVHLFTYYQEHFPGSSLSQTEQFFNREVTLPLHAALKETDIDSIVSAIQEAINTA